MANIARLGVALGLNSAEFVTGIDAASRKLDNFAVAAVGVAKNAVLALGAALAVATYKAVSYADEIADAAAANDIAIDSIIKLTNALENSGGKGANAVKMLSSFTDFVDKAAKGSFEGQKTFSDLGISLKDIGNLSTQDLLLKTAQAIAEIEDPLTRSARAADLFSKSSKGVDMVEFVKGLKEGKGATKEQEQAIKDAAEAFDLFKSAGRDIAMLITEVLGPALLRLGKYLKDLDISNLSFIVGARYIGFGTGNDPDVKILAITEQIDKLQKTKNIAIANGRTENIAIDKMIASLKKEQDALLEIIEVRQLANEKSKDGNKIEQPKRLVTPGVDPKAKAAADKAAADAKKFADMLQQKQFEEEKLNLENRYFVTNNLIKKYESEAEQIRIERNKSEAQVRLENSQKNIAEENKFTIQNSSILKEQLLTIENKHNEKIAALKYKYKIEELNKEFDIEQIRIDNISAGIVQHQNEIGQIKYNFLNENQKIEIEYETKKSRVIFENNKKNILEENQFTYNNEQEKNLKLNQINAEYFANKTARAVKFQEEETQRNLDQNKEINEILNQEEIKKGIRKKVITDIAAQSNAQLVNLAMAQEMFLIEQKSRYMKSEDVQLEKELLQIKYKHDEVVLSIYNNEQLSEDAKEKAYALENRNQEIAIGLAKDRLQILKDQKSGGMMEGFLFRMNTFGKDMETSFEAGGKAFDSMISSMSSGLEEFVRKGELDFDKFAKSIIQDMLAIQLRASATNLFSMMAKSFVSTVTGGSPTYSSMPAGVRADGGPVESGSPYVVGERGPELFVPRSAGAIVPNHSMAMMGGSTNVTNYNIQAIDTKSFEDRILGSSKAVWAANAYGSKNLSLGRGRT